MAVYCDRDRYKNLSFVERLAPFDEKIVLTDDHNYRVDLRLSQDESRRAILFATRPLTVGEEWTKLKKGRLVIVEGGEFRWDR